MLYQKEDELRRISELHIASSPLIVMLFGGGASLEVFFINL